MSLDKTLNDIYRRDIKFDRYEVETVLPEHFLDRYPRLVSFLKAYYKSLEDSANPVSDIKDLMVARDIVQTREEFLSFISSELLLGKPYFESFNDKRSALQYSSLLYRSKGTEFSIKQFFRIFYGVDIDVGYGRDEMFIIGDPTAETIEFTGGSGESNTDFDITFPNGTIEVTISYIDASDSSTKYAQLTEGVHYVIDYTNKKVCLKIHTDTDLGVAVTQTGSLPTGIVLRIQTNLSSFTTIGSDVTDKRITDNKFYQLYGLLVSTPLSVNIWQEAYKTFVHPAGMFLSGEVALSSTFLAIRDIPVSQRAVWQISSGLGAMPDAIIQPPPPVIIETAARVMLAQNNLGLHTTSYAEIGPGPNGYKVLSRVNDQIKPQTVGNWHTQYENMADADDINARTLDDTYADMSNTINLVDENVWHYDYLHPIDTDDTGGRTPIYGYNDVPADSPHEGGDGNEDGSTTFTALGTIQTTAAEVVVDATYVDNHHTAIGILEAQPTTIVGVVPTILGTNYFDNLLGDDATGDGSLASPWASIGKIQRDGMVPGFRNIGIDNGPQNPYRAQVGGNDKYTNGLNGTALNPIYMLGDPDSQDYLNEYPDRPTTQYPNTYITNATHLTGWSASSTYSGVWEVTNPFSSTANNNALFSCSGAEWTADGIMAVTRSLELGWRVSTNDPNDLLAGEWWGDASKIYYKPKSGEVDPTTHHFEFADKLAVFSHKRTHHTRYDGIAIVCSGASGITTSGRGVEITVDGVPEDDWCSHIHVSNCYFKFCKNATAFTIGEYYFISNTTATDMTTAGFQFTGSKGDFPTTDRGFPVSNTLTQNSLVSRLRTNDGIVFHQNSSYTDPNNTNSPNNERQDQVGSNHVVVNCIVSDCAENGFDLTSGSNMIIKDCSTHDNGNAGITIGHYVRNVQVLNHISYNDDYRRNFGGSISLGESRNVTVDGMRSYNPGDRFINVKSDVANVVVKNSTFFAGPDTDHGALIEFSPSLPEYSTVPRNGSTYTTQTPTSFTPDPFETGATAPQRMQNLTFENNVFEVAFGGINSVANEGYRFKVFFKMQILPIKGYDFTFSGNQWKTSVLNAQFQPNTASDLPAANYGPYKIKNNVAGQTTGGEPVIDELCNQTYLAAGNFPNESDLWNFSPTGFPNGRETSNDSSGELTGVFNTSKGLTVNDTQGDLGLYSSASSIAGQSSNWDTISVIGINRDTNYEYWERTNWTIAAPSSTGTSRAVGYKDSGIVNVTAQAPWSGDHRLSAGPMVCMNSAVSEFGLSFVWYAGAAGNASYLALFEVGQQDTDLNLVGISAPYPHTDGVDLRLQMKVTNGLLRCYAGKRPTVGTLPTVENQFSPTLIPLTTTEGGATFSNTYDIATNNANLYNSTTHGVYLINNETAGSRTASLQYIRYPDLLMDVG